MRLFQTLGSVFEEGDDLLDRVLHPVELAKRRVATDHPVAEDPRRGADRCGCRPVPGRRCRQASARPRWRTHPGRACTARDTPPRSVRLPAWPSNSTGSRPTASSSCLSHSTYQRLPKYQVTATRGRPNGSVAVVVGSDAVLASPATPLRNGRNPPAVDPRSLSGLGDTSETFPSRRSLDDHCFRAFLCTLHNACQSALCCKRALFLRRSAAKACVEGMRAGSWCGSARDRMPLCAELSVAARRPIAAGMRDANRSAATSLMMSVRSHPKREIPMGHAELTLQRPGRARSRSRSTNTGCRSRRTANSRPIRRWSSAPKGMYLLERPRRQDHRRVVGPVLRARPATAARRSPTPSARSCASSTSARRSCARIRSSSSSRRASPS